MFTTFTEEYGGEFGDKPLTYIDEETGELKCHLNGKLCYPTVTQAKKARKHYELKYFTYYRVYLCPHCNKHHLSSTTDKYKKNT